MEAGYMAGPLFLAHMYRTGDGVEQDYLEAKRLYEKARLLQGDGVRKGLYEVATLYLAELSLKGEGTAEDPQMAFKLYYDAAQHGSLYGAWQVGKMCEQGKGVQRDVSTAIAWYRSAAELGYAPAQKDLDRLAPKK
jgi:TPR repeat protein